jgi:predicted alpha/beta-hydrolase family hydrolase
VREASILVREQSITAAVHGEGSTAVVLGHGAGGSRGSGLLVRLADALASSGRCAVLYNFPYSERRRRIPDPPELLEATATRVGEYARETLRAARVVHGGKSMGGRIASQAVAKGAPADALVFLGYPLHPPGRTDALRDKHLSAVRVPMLFVQGTRDAFARWDLLEGVLARLEARASLVRVEDGDHSFAVRRRTGRTPPQVEGYVFDAIASWLAERGL